VSSRIPMVSSALARFRETVVEVRWGAHGVTDMPYVPRLRLDRRAVVDRRSVQFEFIDVESLTR